MSVGQKVRMLREEKNLSQDDLAKAVGYKTRSSIAKIESGDSDPSQKMLLKIANALEVSPADLIDDSITIIDNVKTEPVITPKTPEARILCAGIDQMPEDARKKAVEMMNLVFEQYRDYFMQGGKEG